MEQEKYQKRINTDALKAYLLEQNTEPTSWWKENLLLLLITLFGLLGLAYLLYSLNPFAPRGPETNITPTEINTDNGDLTLDTLNNEFVDGLPANDTTDSLSEENDANSTYESPVEEIVEPDNIVDEEPLSLRFSGNKEPYGKVTFSITPFRKDRRYTIDFGDGRVKTMRRKNINYSYSYQGNYMAQITEKEDGEVTRTTKKKVYISE